LIFSRVYQPSEDILDGKWPLPQVVEQAHDLQRLGQASRSVHWTGTAAGDTPAASSQPIPATRVLAEGSFDRAAHGRDNPKNSEGGNNGERRAVRKSSNRGRRSSDANYAGAEGGGAAGHSDAGRLDNERSPFERRSQQRHSGRNNLGSGNRRERQKPYGQPSQKLERLRDYRKTDRKPDAERQPLAPPTLTTAPRIIVAGRGRANREETMADPIYKVVEVVGTSEQSISKAIDNAINKASETLRNLGWFEVAQMRGAIKEGKVQRYQVTLKVGFTLE
jgi:dodecin